MAGHRAVLVAALLIMFPSAWSPAAAQVSFPHDAFHDLVLPTEEELVERLVEQVLPRTKTERDADRDAMGDAWEESYQNAQQTVEALQDLDRDCLLSAGEFAWQTAPVGPVGPLFPNARDFDGDNWPDGEEVAHWNDPSNDVAPYFARAAGCPDRGPVERVPASGGTAVVDLDYFQDPDRDGLFTTWDPDSDNDGLLDGDEAKGATFWGFASDPARSDTDGDGLDDASESGDAGWGADPRVVDTDGDGWDDGDELLEWLSVGLDPRDALDNDGLAGLLDEDSDGDKLGDADERAYGANFTRPDTDGDGMLDGWEVANALAPGDPADAARDEDGDGLTNVEEHRHGSHPRREDTDLDGLDDATEVDDLGTSPALWDTDGDTLPDGWEAQHELDPLDASDEADDPDADGWDEGDRRGAFTNGMEYRYGRPSAWDEATQGAWTGGTLPNDPDTNDNGIFDGEEYRLGVPGAATLPGVDAADVDGDGLSNAQEISLSLDGTRADTDGDGVCDGGYAPACRSTTLASNAPGELRGHASNPYPPNVDTDGDGLDDWIEAALGERGVVADQDGVAPILDFDSDNDTLSDGYEGLIGSDPLAADTDGDTLDDAEELRYGTDATDPDSDGDGLSDGEERTATRTDPRMPDSDFDGLTDREEVLAETNAWRADTDGDLMPDAWEVAQGLQPRIPDAAVDHDGDGLSALREHGYGSDPFDRDTDADLLEDGLEAKLGLHPARPEWEIVADEDADGLDGYAEAAIGTLPYDSDSDGDGLGDLEEVGYATAPLPDPFELLRLPRLARLDVVALHLDSDPTKADTDADGVNDGKERALWIALAGEAAIRTDYDDRGNAGALVAGPTFTSNLRRADADADGLDDGVEFLTLGTDPRTSDTDGDSYSDFDEVQRGSSPRDADDVPAAGPRAEPWTDTDRDGISDADEMHVTLTDHEDPDTDDDGLDDLAELKAWRAKRDATIAEVRHLLRDADVDDDGVPDGEEFAFALLPRARVYITDPEDPDTDEDGIVDGDEARNALVVKSWLVVQQEAARAANEPGQLLGPQGLATSASPLSADVPGAFRTILLAPASGHEPHAPSQDGMGCDAQTENPRPDATDTDGDGLTDGEETNGYDPQVSDPCRVDGDGDEILDPAEVNLVPRIDIDGDGWLPALDADTDGDLRGDKEEDENHNARVDRQELDFLDADTDDDGLHDGIEDTVGATSARLPDTDADGLPDGLELGATSADPRWTDRSARLDCGGAAYTGGIGGGSDPLARDTDGDGLVDGLEDYDHDGVYAASDDYHGSPTETLPAGAWLELHPLDADSDGDGLTDGEEINGDMGLIDPQRDYCGLVLGLGGSLLTGLGYDEFARTSTNAHAADTDGDGIPDGADVDPKDALSLIEITALKYQQLTKVDIHEAYAPDLVLLPTLAFAGNQVALNFGTIDDFESQSLRSVLEARNPEVSPSSLMHDVAEGIGIIVPQSGLDFVDDPSAKLSILVTATEDDLRAHDPIDLSPGEGSSMTSTIDLVTTPSGPRIIDTSGASASSPGLRSPKNGRLVLEIQTPFDRYFLDRALRMAGLAEMEDIQ